MTEIQYTTEFDDILGNANFDKIDIARSAMDNDNQRDEADLLGVASASTNDASGTQGMAPQYGV